MRYQVARLLFVFFLGAGLVSTRLDAALDTKGATESDKKALERWKPLALSLRDEARKVLADAKAGTWEMNTLSLRWVRLNEETLILIERLESSGIREAAKEMGTTLQNWYDDFVAEKEKRGQIEIIERLADFLTERLKK